MLLTVAVIMAAMITATALLALARQGPPAPVVEPNPGTSNAAKSGNGIAVGSSALTKNALNPNGTLGKGNNLPGQTGPSGGARGDEIKAAQEACNLANEK